MGSGGQLLTSETDSRSCGSGANGEAGSEAGTKVVEGATMSRFERELREHVKAFVRGVEHDPADAGEAWFVAQALSVWETDGARAAVDAMILAWDRSAKRRRQEVVDANERHRRAAGKSL